MKYIDFAIPVRGCVEKCELERRLIQLAQRYGYEAVRRRLGEMFEYEVLRCIGDPYREVVYLNEGDLDELEERLSEGGNGNESEG